MEGVLLESLLAVSVMTLVNRILLCAGSAPQPFATVLLLLPRWRRGALLRRNRRGDAGDLLIGSTHFTEVALEHRLQL